MWHWLASFSRVGPHQMPPTSMDAPPSSSPHTMATLSEDSARPPRVRSAPAARANPCFAFVPHLHYVSLCRSVEELLAYGASPDIAAASGLLPIHAATRAGHMSTARVLTRASPDAHTQMGSKYDSLPGPRTHRLAPFAMPSSSEVPYFEFPPLPEAPRLEPDEAAVAYGRARVPTSSSLAEGARRLSVGEPAASSEGSPVRAGDHESGGASSEMERRRAERRREFAARRAALEAERKAFDDEAAATGAAAFPDVSALLNEDRGVAASGSVMAPVEVVDKLMPDAEEDTSAASSAAAAVLETEAALASFSKATSISAAGAANDIAKVYGAKAAAAREIRRDQEEETVSGGSPLS
mmetsp:Transcript_15790/g.44368  ORF Transcript_15790/g.44368 Transcript_15790/m.44368 type:complete len:354 (+) Transcript_15790:1291-2352(+)